MSTTQMDNFWATAASTATERTRGRAGDLQLELFRKAIHFSVALVPLLASISVSATMALLAAGVLAYTYAEQQRLRGFSIALISAITSTASRPRDRGRFVFGPVTLGIGAMLALLLYPEPSATIAIFALAFGDGVASVVGKFVGRIRIPLTGGKTLAGSAACFIVVFLLVYRMSGRVSTAAALGIGATVLEVLPSGDLDNIILPVGTGFVASQLLG